MTGQRSRACWIAGLVLKEWKKCDKAARVSCRTTLENRKTTFPTLQLGLSSSAWGATDTHHRAAWAYAGSEQYFAFGLICNKDNELRDAPCRLDGEPHDAGAKDWLADLRLTGILGQVVTQCQGPKSTPLEAPSSRSIQSLRATSE